LANIINGTSTGSGGLITTGDSSDELQIQTAETTAITVDSSQNVGIGTNAPTGAGRILHINNSGTDGADVCDLRFTTGTTGATSGDGVRIRLANVGDLDINNLEANSVLISTQNTERMRVTSDGYLRLAGGGIQFNGDTAAANALDDYEEGTWTPTVGGNATYVTQTGSYVKIGRLVLVKGTLEINIIGTGNTTVISGLPFTAGTIGSSTDEYTVPVDKSSNLSASVTYINLRTSGTTLYATYRTAASATATINGAFMQNSTEVQFTGSYISSN
jgi:hypothetical protein